MSKQAQKPAGLFGRLFGGKPATGADDAALSAAEPDPDTSVQAATPSSVNASGTSEAGNERQSTTGSPAAADGAPSPAPSDTPQPKKTGWLSRLSTGLAKTSQRLTESLTGLLTKRKLDAATLEDLEDLLIGADLGVETATRITSALSRGRFEKGISADDVRAVLAEEVERVLAPVAKPLIIEPVNRPHVIVVVGVNGSGKTTTIGKLAARYRSEGRKVMLAAGDTFRAAAVEQLKIWGERTGATVMARDTGADASGLAFDALKAAQAGQYDVLIVDTAGRLQNRQALMDELEKVVRVLSRLLPEAPHDVVLVLDATTGQNALQQVEVFRERAGVTGLVMTKLDGTARGGILVAIAAKHSVPIHAIGVGEGVDDLQAFDAREFARAMVTEEKY
ncbi:MAG: signal recognition particle-docking protein FtsY [Hyphomicrobiaceae bacterium]|nr:signal recognition particle-docking protein FtsY [Hyphomicrobiaceae bacterium]